MVFRVFCCLGFGGFRFAVVDFCLLCSLLVMVCFDGGGFDSGFGLLGRVGGG